MQDRTVRPAGRSRAAHRTGAVRRCGLAEKVALEGQRGGAEGCGVTLSFGSHDARQRSGEGTPPLIEDLDVRNYPLGELGRYEFNAIMAEGRAFVFQPWLDGTEVTEWLVTGAGGASSGDLYARLAREGSA